MINWKTATLLTLLVSGIFFTIPLLISGTSSNAFTTAVICVTSLFVLVNFIQFIGKPSSAESKVQRFMIGTSIQMICSLFILLIYRYTQTGFKVFAINFLILFGIHLFLQALLLIFSVRKKQI
jgi:hypothetical protein